MDKYRPILPKINSTINQSSLQVTNDFENYNVVGFNISGLQTANIPLNINMLGQNISSFQVMSVPVNNFGNCSIVDLTKMNQISPQETISSPAVPSEKNELDCEKKKKDRRACRFSNTSRNNIIPGCAVKNK